MALRLRFGPLTVGKTGIRLSMWRKAGGLSIPLLPLSPKGRTSFGVVRLGPFRWWLSKGLAKGQKKVSRGLPSQDTLLSRALALLESPDKGQKKAREGLRSQDSPLSHGLAPSESPPARLEDFFEAFLKDVLAYPDSGVTRRWERLGITANEGLYIRYELARKGLIQEKRERNPAGKTIISIRLTEKGKESLEPPPPPKDLSEAFLKDVLAYPDSGVTSRCGRLEVSASEGREIRAKLLAEGLIQEQRKPTRNGFFLTLVSLTEKGRQEIRVLRP